MESKLGQPRYIPIQHGKRLLRYRIIGHVARVTEMLQPLSDNAGKHTLREEGQIFVPC
jgi:hypothetical protein